MAEFRMPSLGADMEAGTLVEWLKDPGDAVERGDIIAVVDTQKGAIEIEVFENGIVQQTLVEPGERVPVGTPLAMIGNGEEETGLTVPPTAPSPKAQAQETVGADLGQEKAEIASVRLGRMPGRAGRQRISPAARRLCEEAGLDLSVLPTQGSGVSGAIALADVRALLEQGARPIESEQPASGPEPMRAAIAAAVSQSKREIPHYYLSHTISLENASRFLLAVNTDRAPSERLVMATLFMKAVARAVARYPEFNGHYEAGEYRASKPVHVGMVITIRGGGLVAPAIHDVDGLDLPSLMTRMRDLVARVRSGRLRASELSDPTISVTSLGDRGVETVYGVIYPPQVAIVGFGTPVERAWAEAGAIAARQVVSVTLAADHRVSDGHRGGLFLNAIDQALQDPEAL